MADHAYAIVTTDEFKTWMGITVNDHNAIIELIVNSVTDWIESYCDRRIKARSGDITETWNGDGTITYYVEHPPINGDITSLTVENHPGIDPTDTNEVRVESAIGKITLLMDTFGSEWPQNCEIEYNGGYTTVPSDIVGVARKLIKLTYIMRDGNRELIKSTSNSVTGETVNYIDSIVTPDITGPLDRKYVLRRNP